MRVVTYEFADPKSTVAEMHRAEVDEIEQALATVNAQTTGSRSYRRDFGMRLESLLARQGWEVPLRISLRSPAAPNEDTVHTLRGLDAAKNRVAFELGLGHYPYLLYGIYGLLPIFHERGLIDAGIVAVPTQELARQLPSGISYFEQVTADLEARGPSNLDIPVMVLGFTPNTTQTE